VFQGARGAGSPVVADEGAVNRLLFAKEAPPPKVNGEPVKLPRLATFPREEAMRLVHERRGTADGFCDCHALVGTT
jgi:hypothetical protein